MADSKLRLSIVTQLDNAGIKATKEQIDKLEDALKKTKDTGQDSASQLEKALGGLPGPIGKVGKAMGGLVSTVTSVFGAFMMGVEIGNMINDHILKPLGLIEDYEAKAKKEAAEYNYALKNLKDTLEDVQKKEAERIANAEKASDKAIKRIDDETAAYMRQSSALEGIKSAQGNAELLKLQRDKFEDMRAYQVAGYGEAAEQLGRYYDVLEAELKQKQEIEAFDRESVKLTEQMVAKEEAFAKAAERAKNAKADYDRLQGELADWKKKNTIGGMGEYVDSEWAEQEWIALEKRVNAAERAYEKANAIMEKRSEALETVDAEAVKRSLERANLIEGGNLNIDRAAAAYDDYAAQYHNPLNADIDQNWSSELLKNSQDSYQALLDTRDNTAAFAEKLEELLGMKQ